MNRGVHRFSSITVLSIVQSAELGNNVPESSQYKEIEYTDQYSVCKYFLILSQRRAVDLTRFGGYLVSS